MRRSLHGFMGSANGWVIRLSPKARLAAGALCFAACMAGPTGACTGILFIAFLCLLWTAACRPPFRVLLGALLLGLALFLPYFLLPLVPRSVLFEPDNTNESFNAVLSVVLRGMSGMLVSIATLSTLGQTDLRQALIGLPMPRIVCIVVLQIVHQTGILLSETLQIAAAVTVRGASSKRWASFRLVFTLPKVWMPRVIDRAERVAAAMALRGVLDAPFASLEKSDTQRMDYFALGGATAALAGAIALRIVVS